MSYRQARSLDVLVRETNGHAAHRNKASDGGLASAAHHVQNPDSDHEPNAAGVWRAYDITHDPAGGIDGNNLAHRIATKLGKHPALTSGAYVIWNRHIISTDRISEGWRNYAGTDPHTGHVHISVATAAAGYDSTKPWNLWPETPGIDDVIDRLEHLIAARKPSPIRALLRTSRQAAIAARKLAKA